MNVGDLSEHFDRWEFACRGENCCGRSAPISERLIDALEGFCKIISLNDDGVHIPMRVHSGFRCLTHNRTVGSHDASYHVLGMAADVSVLGLSPARVARMAEGVFDFERGGIGVYCGFVHLDVRKSGKARW